MKRIYTDKGYQVLKAELPAGKRLPVHYATSNAYVIATKGSAELIFSEGQQILKHGMQLSISEKKLHTLQIISDFEAFIIIGEKASIQFAGGTQEAKTFAAAV